MLKYAGSTQIRHDFEPLSDAKRALRDVTYRSVAGERDEQGRDFEGDPIRGM
jgi:hypothetical protein